MSYYDYKQSVYIEMKQYPFYAIIMAAMRQADTDNAEKLRTMFPETWRELEARYHAPGGLLEGEEPPPPTCGHSMPQEDRDAFGIKSWDPHCAREPDHEGDHAISQEGVSWSNDGEG